MCSDRPNDNRIKRIDGKSISLVPRSGSKILVVDDEAYKSDYNQEGRKEDDPFVVARQKHGIGFTGNFGQLIESVYLEPVC